ncbi:DoxX family membrane protein [Flavobacteriaceae bacterium R38]|nr:DoxX family membrane protein [Flavobacteriaceae bacterium R38]
MKNGNFLIRAGFGLLFIWGGLEKFFEGFLGGVGLDNMAAFLSSSGLGFLGETGTYVLGAILAVLELVAGIALIINKKLFEAYLILAFIMLIALVMVHIPSGVWMNIMIHLTLFLTLLGLCLNSRSAK